MELQITSLLALQRKYFQTGQTLDAEFRIQMLRKLYRAVKEHEPEIAEALHADLHKSPFEAYATETGMLLGEIRRLIRLVPAWCKPRRVGTPLMHFHSRSRLLHDPYGVVLIMSPWNYPLQLTLLPLAGAIAAGNCCVVKPSAYAPHTSALVARILSCIYPAEFVSVIEGGRAANQELLAQRFDYIFFTGSPATGRYVMEQASRYLTPVTLELGGKSPCIVDRTADIDLSAKRIVWGKFLNAGQTCIAPDYIWADAAVKDRLVEALQKYITAFYGPEPLKSADYPKIINAKHFQRLQRLMHSGHVIFGGDFSETMETISPTLLDRVDWDSAIMQEEIFGPLLPILTFNDYREVMALLSQRPKSLALYLFSNDKARCRETFRKLSFGGGCINDAIIHIANENMPFGGVGNSGMGHYHGKYSLETFSHTKSVTRKSNWLDIGLRYPPFGDAQRMKLLKKFM